MSDWNSVQYLKFKNERTQPSADLVKRIDIKKPKRIIDIGCGPGNSTYELRKRFPDAYVLGVDFSPNMIEKAENDYKNIDFMLFDAQRNFDKLVGNFDIVFSNACIQWIPNHKMLLSNMMSILNKNGVMAVQIPYQYEQPMHKIVKEVAASEEWNGLFSSERVFNILEENEYFDLLSDISSDFSIWKTIYFHRMPSQRSIIEWYRSTGLKPYLEVLDDDKKERFENAVFEKVKKAYPVQKNSEVIFKFPRLFFTAVK
ncbi:MAG: methyltransferase domain-containing protein [Acetobacter sp.]|nr:methyltransferase domain-containing protein [Bacteroides sp.]MCM1341530.1 methyltransferase domain-containing protein [Acetobacter sp.]MCM1433682.1 methyltransferase domain-containing protein [Clostridiales bacterium]